MVKKQFKHLLIVISSFLFFFPTKGSSTDTSQTVFDSRVKTLQVYNPDNFLNGRVIRLGTSDRLMINFDIIEDNHEYLRYKLIHCNADWKPSRLLESEYIDGFNEAEIYDYAYSSNTYVHYVNYNIEIPNEDLPIIESGNYLLQVYRENDPDDILLQCRFAVTDNSLGINGAVTTRTDKGFNTEYQQLYFNVDGGLNSRINPYQDIIITVEQNNRPETMRTITHPMRVDGRNIIYEHDMGLVFNAGNEYRRFETVRTDYPGMHTDSVRFGGTNWHAYLAKDEPRVEKDYSYDNTQMGRFKINEYYSDDPDLGADYVTVHFTLDMPYTPGIDVYIDGDFTNHKFEDFNRMTYDHNSGVYFCQIPLKQGSYNYQYVVSNNAGITVDPSPIEGNKYETRNEYIVKAFLRQPGSRADKLVGFTRLISVD